MKPTPGKALFSTVDSTSVVVIRWGADDLDLTCGGAAMTDTKPEADAAPTATGADAALLGKRYTTDDGAIELLVTKSGAGPLAVGGSPLGIKSATPLPASD